MPYNGSGTFLRVRNWVSDAAASIKIKADLHDSEDDNFAQGLSNALTKDGQTQPTQNIPMNGKKIINLGTPTAGGDATTKAYVDSIKTFSDFITLTGIDGKGQIKFTGSQSPTTEPTSRPLGLNFDQADLFFGVKPDSLPGASDVPRFIWNDIADGSGKDLMTLNEEGELTINQTDIGAGVALKLVKTLADANTGPNIVTYRRHPDPAALDYIGSWYNYGRNDANADVQYTAILNQIKKTTTNDHEGEMRLAVAIAGTLTSRITINKDATTISGKVLAGDIDATNLKSIGLLTVEKTADDASTGPYLVLDRISTSPAAVDPLGYIYFRGRDSTASGTDPTIGVTDYARISGHIIDPVNGQEAGQMNIGVINGAGANFYGVVLYGTKDDNRVVVTNLRGSGAELSYPKAIGSLYVERSDDGSGVGPWLTLDRKSASPAANDYLGSIGFTGMNSAQAVTTYGSIVSRIADPVNNSEDGLMYFQVMRAGTLTNALTIDDNSINVTGSLTATGHVTGSGGAFIGNNTNAILGLPSAMTGTVYLRPNGYNSATRQVSVDGATGDMACGGDFAAGTGVFRATGLNVYVGPNAAGSIYLRPSGWSSATNQMTVASNGFVTILGGCNISLNSTVGPTAATAADANEGIVLGSLGNMYLKRVGSGAANTHMNIINKCDTTPATVGTITSSGSATQYNTSSDELLKDFAVDPYDPLKAIDIIRRDPVREFDWKNGDGHAVGWGAQTSYAISPDLATPPPPYEQEYDADGEPLPMAKVEPKAGDPGYHPWGMDQSKRTPYLWAALTWALDQIDQLKADVAALKGTPA